jgi:hypothetical protein
MTAIGIAKVQSGFVVASDGLMRIDAETRARVSQAELASETENAQKIFEISNRDKALACAVFGTIGNDDLSFNLVEEAKKQAAFLAGQKFVSFKRYADQVCFNISQRLRRAKQFQKLHAHIVFAVILKPDQYPCWLIFFLTITLPHIRQEIFHD